MIKYRPKLDKMYWILLGITDGVCCVPLLVVSLLDPAALFISVPTVIFVNYFFVSPLFGYVALLEDGLFIKYGFILKKSIPYGRIRELKTERRYYSETILSLKNALDHVLIKYNRFDVTVVSVKENEDFVKEVKSRIEALK